jgi:hypothetical protein
MILRVHEIMITNNSTTKKQSNEKNIKICKTLINGSKNQYKTKFAFEAS